MIIKNVLEFKNAGVWSNFTSKGDVSLAPRTLIYGFNGSGKTTLSRVFASIERESLEGGLPTETIFKIETSDKTVVAQSPISNPFGKKLLVFNKDFVTRNFAWDESSTNGIAYLSEKKLDARKEYDELAPRLSVAEKQNKLMEAAKTKANKSCGEFKTRVARNIRELASSSTYTQSYDARKIQSHYNKSPFNPEQKLSEEGLKASQEILMQREPLPVLGFSPSLPNNLVEWFHKSHSLLTESVSAMALEEFEAHSDALRWVEEGLHYHENNSLADCLLCGNSFSESRRSQLKTLFDNSWAEAIRKLDDAIAQGRAHQVAMRELYRSIPKEAELTAEERVSFAASKASTEAAITELGSRVGELIVGLKARAANPTKKATVEGELAEFSLDDWLASYAKIEEEISTTIKKHNLTFASFAKMQADAFKLIEAHVLASNQSE